MKIKAVKRVKINESMLNKPFDSSNEKIVEWHINFPQVKTVAVILGIIAAISSIFQLF